MSEILKRKDGESNLQYMSRLYRNKVELGLSSKELNNIINEETGENYAESTTRCNSKTYNEGFDDGFEKALNDKDSSQLKELEEKKKELEKERIKLRTEKIEYNKLLREESREELWWEYLQNSINSMKPFEVPVKNNNLNDIIKDGLLVISDCHYGRKCTIKGLDGEIVSEYNIEIFKSRMWDLLNQVIECCEERNLTHLNILNNGDFIDGLLRISQLQSLQLGVVDSALEYGEFMSTWINELSKK